MTTRHETHAHSCMRCLNIYPCAPDCDPARLNLCPACAALRGVRYDELTGEPSATPDTLHRCDICLMPYLEAERCIIGPRRDAPRRSVCGPCGSNPLALHFTALTWIDLARINNAKLHNPLTMDSDREYLVKSVPLYIHWAHLYSERAAANGYVYQDDTSGSFRERWATLLMGMEHH